MDTKLKIVLVKLLFVSLLPGLNSCVGYDSEIGCWEQKSIASHGVIVSAEGQGLCFTEEGRMQTTYKGTLLWEGSYTRSENGSTIVLAYDGEDQEVLTNVRINSSELTFDRGNISWVMKRQ